MYSDPEVTRHLGALHVTRIEEVEARHPHLISTSTRYGPGYGVWAAERLDSGQVVGVVLLKPLPGLDGALTEDIEVGWHLARDSWGKGYATEMGAAALTHGFEAQRLDHIHALAKPGNAASLAVMRRLGMARMGSNRAYYGGMSGAVYQISAAQWAALRCAPGAAQ